jgi:hypothetical protein
LCTFAPLQAFLNADRNHDTNSLFCQLVLNSEEKENEVRKQNHLNGLKES